MAHKGIAMARILIIDDDESVRNSLTRCFAGRGHEILLAASLSAGMELAMTGVDIIYLDLGLPDGDGKKAIDDLSAIAPFPEIIVITGMGNNYGAQETMASGAWDYITKPASPHIVKASLQSALNYRKDRIANLKIKSAFDECGIIGDSPSMKRAKRLISRAAESEASVLILGETGVGKELVAQAIHANSCRRAGPFVVVDCSNLSESLVESLLYGHAKGAFTGAHTDHKGLVARANGGTLFLDEVGELPPSLQKSFLRVLQEHRFRAVGAAQEQTSDFRLVAATNRDLESMTHSGNFRSDLLFRLRTVEVALPPLRDRDSDVTMLAEHFVARYCERYGQSPKRISPQLGKVLEGYTWPGNVRELGNVMEAAVIEAGDDPAIYPKHLPRNVRMSCLDTPDRGIMGDRVERSAPDTTQGQAPAARDSSPEAAGVSAVPTYEDYKSLRDQDYFTQLMAACDHDIARASQTSGLSVPSIYRHLGLAGIPTRSKVKR